MYYGWGGPLMTRSQLDLVAAFFLVILHLQRAARQFGLMTTHLSTSLYLSIKLLTYLPIQTLHPLPSLCWLGSAADHKPHYTSSRPTLRMFPLFVYLSVRMYPYPCPCLSSCGYLRICKAPPCLAVCRCSLCAT